MGGVRLKMSLFLAIFSFKHSKGGGGGGGEGFSPLKSPITDLLIMFMSGSEKRMSAVSFLDLLPPGSYCCSLFDPCCQEMG